MFNHYFGFDSVKYLEKLLSHENPFEILLISLIVNHSVCRWSNECNYYRTGCGFRGHLCVPEVLRRFSATV